MLKMKSNIFPILYWIVPAFLIFDAISILFHIFGTIGTFNEFRSFGIGYLLFGQSQDGWLGLSLLMLDASVKFFLVFLFAKKSKYALVLSVIFLAYMILNLLFVILLTSDWYFLVGPVVILIISLLLIVRRDRK